jgi:effector-binding domain-containing protein
MIDEPRVVDVESELTATIRLTVPRDEIRSVMHPAITEVLSTVAAQGVGPAGPVFSHHFRMTPDVFDFEVGVPVRAPVTPAGRVKPSRLPAARIARTIYRGSYEGLGDAWGELVAWIAAQGLTPAPNLWERYVAGPESSPDPAEWQTELCRPLAR